MMLSVIVMHIPKPLQSNWSVHPMTNMIALNATTKPTKETYDGFQLAYERINTGLFGGELPNCLITLQRRKWSYGYFSGGRFAREDGTATDEIALNPAHFRDRPVTEVLATLAHEMVHLWQHHFGKPGRGRYHNKEWAAKMKKIGLQPTDTGEEGGKETGDKVHHIIVPDGRFDRLVRKILARGFVITWMERPQAISATGQEGAGENGSEGKSGKRVKYTCPRCDLNAWAKHDARLICGEDMSAMESST